MTYLSSISNRNEMNVNSSPGSLDLLSTESYVHPADFSTNGLTSTLFSRGNGNRSNVTLISLVGEGEIFVLNTPLIVATIVSMVVIVIANGLIIICIIGVPKLRTSFNIYICSLAVADLLVGIVASPFVLIYYLNDTWPLGISMCTCWCLVDLASCTISTLHLCLLAYERYIAIVKPMQHLKHVTCLRTSMSLVFIWVLGFALWAGTILYHRDPTRFVIDEHQCVCNTLPAKEFVLCQCILAYYCPIAFMIYLYGRIIFALSPKKTKGSSKEACHENNSNQSHINVSNIGKTQTDDVRVQTSSIELVSISNHIDNNSFRTNTNTDHITENQQRNDVTLNEHKNDYSQTLQKCRQEKDMNHRRKQQLRCVRTLGVVMVTFMICWVPYFIVLPLLAYCPTCVSFIIHETSVVMAYCNSSLNPLIYFFLNKSYRSNLKRLLCPCHKRK